MESGNSLTFQEAILLFTHLKLKIAKSFREGIQYGDFLAFEKELEKIEKTFKIEKNNIIKDLTRTSDN